MTEVIESFKAGDDVPEWLVIVDPTQAQTARLDLKFAMNLTVVEAYGRYWLIPDQIENSIFIRGDAQGGAFYIAAADKPVVLPLEKYVLWETKS